MRRLPSFAALRCEIDDGKKCACRCDGKFHGANRVTTLEGLKTLPYGDPHKTPDIDAKQARELLKRVKWHLANTQMLSREPLYVWRAYRESFDVVGGLINGNKVARSREAKRTAPPIRVTAAANAERHHD
jgi:hypothetical protein